LKSALNTGCDLSIASPLTTGSLALIDLSITVVVLPITDLRLSLRDLTAKP